MPIKVWYFLVDSNGVAYKASTTSKVTLDDGADVDDLRKAIKAENTNKLSHVDSQDLKIYLTKDDIFAEQPLEEDSPVTTTFGHEKKFAVWVVVTDSTQPIGTIFLNIFDLL